MISLASFSEPVWQKTWSAAILLGFVLCLSTVVPTVTGASAEEKRDPMLTDFVISPDGRVVAFEFGPSLRGPFSLGLYEWQTEKLTRIPNPPGTRLSDPNFSYDGKRLAVVIEEITEGGQADVAVIDLGSMQLRQITHRRNFLRSAHYPVFQPGTDNILYVENGIGSYSNIHLVDSHGNDQALFSEDDGFTSTIFRPFFVNPQEVCFLAMSPVNHQLLQNQKQLGIDELATVAYRLRFGSPLEIAFPKSERRLQEIQERAQPLLSSLHPELGSLTGTRGGRKLFFVTQTNPETAGLYNFEIFEMEKDGVFTQLTHLNSYISHAAISYDSSIIAFDNDPTRNPARQTRLDLAILDLHDNRIIETGLLDKLAKRADFRSP